MKPTRIVWISDPHCGHLFGLTPTEYQIKEVANPEDSHARRRNKCAIFERALWNWYCAELKALGPVDGLIASGDMLDGSGARSGGSELISADKNTQIEIAERVIKQVRAKKIVMVYGTPYHTSDGDKSTDLEDIVAEKVHADKIGSHEWLTVNGNTFDIKHKVGSSQVPYGRATAVSRDAIWSMLWAEAKMTPRANIVLRSHVHYPVCVHDPLMNYTAMTSPGLQWSTKYGARECIGLVGCGFVHFDMYPDGKFTYEYHITKLAQQKAEAIKW